MGRASSSSDYRAAPATTPPVVASSANLSPAGAQVNNHSNGSGHALVGHRRGPSNEGQSPASNASSTQPMLDGSSSALTDDHRAKKRRTGPGSRGVANLTPEQLAKKRANDREAQRAIRERTKNQIDTLEKRIKDLTSQQPYQELQAVIRAKEAVEAENAEIKARLASIMSLIQPVLTTRQGLQPPEDAFASPVANFASVHSGAPPPSLPSVNNASTPGSTTSPASNEPQSWHATSTTNSNGHTFLSPANHVQIISQQRRESVQNLDLGAGEHLKLDFLLDPAQRISRMRTGAEGAQDSPSYRHLPMKHDWSSIQVQANRVGASEPYQLHRLTYAADSSQHTVSTGDYTRPIKNCAPTCPLDSILLDFLHERRQRAAEGVSPQEIVGPRYPSVSSLLNPAHGVYSHPLSKVFTDILATFPGICTLPERVAVLYIMFLLMRWQISPTEENYDLLPAWMHPSPAQLEHAHPAWCDTIPHPRMRDKISSEYNRDYANENFFIPFTNTISLNWPYEETDCLLQSPDGEELLINPVFERHLRRLENWTLGDAFAKQFPQLEGTYNYKKDGSVDGYGRSDAASVRSGG